VTRGIDDVLAEARSVLVRLTPDEAYAAASDGALLVDTRPVALRERDGLIPGAVVVDRNVLEWRLDPVGEHRLAELEGVTQPVIVFCDEGYASSLAAESLQRVGLPNATDLDGGFQAWRAAGLPVEPPAGGSEEPARSSEEPAGATDPSA
jgi:rhodanese-related sulfurtransferase